MNLGFKALMTLKVSSLVGILFFLTPISRYDCRADVMIDDFNASRSYGTCCNEFGTYLSFETNLTQNGNSGTVVISGSATDNGGFYRDLGGAVLWNITSQTNLTVKAKRLNGNNSSNCWVILRDIQNRSAGYAFPISAFPTNSFGTQSIPLSSPTWVDPQGFNYSFITALDVNGGITDDDLPFRIELDEIKLAGPQQSNLPVLSASLFTNNLLVSWLTPSGTNWEFQTAPKVDGSWTKQTNISTVGNLSSYSQSTTGAHRFFRLKNPTGSGFAPFNLASPETAQTPLDGFLSSEQGSITAAASPPPTNNVYTNTFLDVSSRIRSWQRGQFGYYGGVPPNGIGDDLEVYGHEQRNDHSGGTISVTNINYKSHSPILSFPLWARTTDCISQTVRHTTFTPGDPYWPGGYYVSTSTGCNPSSNFSNSVGVASTEWLQVDSFWWNYILWIGNDTGTNWAHRSDSTALHLHTSLSQKYILLSGSASNVVSLEGGFDYHFSDSFINPTNITLLSSKLNADGKIFKKVVGNSTYDATPSVSGTTKYGFNVEIENHSKVFLSRSYHPLFDVPPFTVSVPKLSEIQAHFDEASTFLARDDDEKIPDSAVTYATNSSSVYRTDDVPVYLEFVLTNGPSITNVLTRRLSPVFSAEFRGRKFYRIQTNTDADSLLSSDGANIKLVRSMVYSGKSIDGLATRPSSPAKMLLVHTMPGVVGGHEWAHTRGIPHREIPENFGPLTGAMMNATNQSNGYKINRYERGFLN